MKSFVKIITIYTLVMVCIAYFAAESFNEFAKYASTIFSVSAFAIILRIMESKS